METTFEQRQKFFDGFCNRVSCPCCGYPTLGERGSYQICKICWWEDDGDDDLDEIRNGPNIGYSLSEARINFDIYLVKYSPLYDQRVSGPDSDSIRKMKEDLIKTFNAMVVCSSHEALMNLWQQALLLEKTLYRRFKDEMRRYTMRRIRQDPP
jgi:hypothetical protein